MTPDRHSAHRRIWAYWLGAAVLAFAGGGWLWSNFNNGPEVIAKEQESYTTVPEGQGPDPQISSRSDPAIDLVRVEPDGSALVVGRAGPGTQVSILVDGIIRAQAEADGDGNFVIFLRVVIGTEPRVMWLMAETADGEVLTSIDSVILAPQATGAITPHPVTPDQALPQILRGQGAPGGSSIADQPVVVQDETVSRKGFYAIATETKNPAAPQDVLPAPGGAAPSEVALATIDELRPPSVAGESPAVPVTAPRVLLNTRTGVQVLDSAPLAPSDHIRLDTLSYADDSAVVLRGRSRSDGTVRAYLDNQPVAGGTADVAGIWTLRLTDVAPGDYTLRIEVATPSQGVLGRVEIPFRRESAAVLEQSLNGDAVRAITVQPGATLWAIARTRYGDATRYVQVFEANRDQIRDPNLIFPGQIFGLPDLGEAVVTRP